jgi:triacylglycerol lipase
VKTAQCLLGASNATYCESKDASYPCLAAFSDIGLTLVGDKFKNATTYDAGFVSVKGNAVVASFRGTEPTWSNLVQDLDSIVKTQFDLLPGVNAGTVNTGQVGKGFFNGYLSLQPLFFAQLERAISMTNCTNAERKLYITGHSLGGSIAMLAAMDLKYNLQTKALWSAFSTVTVYTYEAPRSGDADFAEAFHTVTADTWQVRIYRLCHNMQYAQRPIPCTASLT